MRIIFTFLAAFVATLQVTAQTPEWIWFNKTSAAETRFFRKTFELDAVPRRAEISATADDALEVFVNGKRVLGGDSWQNTFKANVREQLVAGKNVIGIRATNGDASPAGVILKLDLGNRRVIVTDTSWHGAAVDADGWAGLAFDDSKWSAVTSLGKLGAAPWGDVLKPEAARAATPAEQLFVAKDFQVELLTSAEPEEGSWVNICKDDKGRFVISPQFRAANPDGGLLRFTVDPAGKVTKREWIAPGLYDAQGLTFANGALWVVINKYSTKFESGLYRVTDDGSDKWAKIELIKKMPGNGEHGPHAVELGPDGNLWVMAGNHTMPPDGLSPDSPHKNWAEDHVLPRQPDGNGHATGVMAPGGYILRITPDTKKFDFFCGGFRNQYDFAFNADGELFTYDADMEYDWGVPWYRPTRLNHCVSGAEFGWRYGTGKWPDYYADSLGASVDIGIGCPTGVSNGKGAKFPAKYQNAIYVLDWTFGRLMAVHLKPEGASYTATWENFVAPAGLIKQGEPKPPLNLTDVLIGNDGAMYFTVGGRGTASGLYKVTYKGKDSTADAWKPNPEGSEARAMRRKLEAFHGKADPSSLDLIFQHLNSSDRHLRYAARIALESQPVETWRDRALNENRPEGGLAALLALTRVGGKAAQEDVIRALDKWPGHSLSTDRQLTALRILQVSIARHGKPSESLAREIVDRISPLYPSGYPLVNREAAQVLIALGDPTVIGKSLQIMAAAKTQEEMIHYLFHLRTAKGWTPDQRAEYLSYWSKDRSGYGRQGDLLKWFEEAGRAYADGASFNNFLKNFLAEAVANMTDSEKAEFADNIAAINKGIPQGRRVASIFPKAKERQFVKEWTTADLAPQLEKVSSRRSFERGAQAFVDAQCLSCHKFGLEGGGVGPDLIAVASRFSRRDILESMTEPSKVVSDQYANTRVVLNDGDDVTGRLVEETADKFVLVPNPLQPEVRVEVKKIDAKSHAFSKTSPMPEGLLNNLTQEDILDLLAFIESGGRRSHPAFAP